MPRRVGEEDRLAALRALVDPQDALTYRCIEQGREVLEPLRNEPSRRLSPPSVGTGRARLRHGLSEAVPLCNDGGIVLSRLQFLFQRRQRCVQLLFLLSILPQHVLHVALVHLVAHVEAPVER